MLRDHYKAAELYERACEGGVAEACLIGGVMYYKGEGIVPDLRKGYELISEACRLGSEQACSLFQR